MSNLENIILSMARIVFACGDVQNLFCFWMYFFDFSPSVSHARSPEYLITDGILLCGSISSFVIADTFGSCTCIMSILFSFSIFFPS